MTIGNDVEGLSKHAFSAKFIFCQASGGQTGQGGGQTGLCGGQTSHVSGVRAGGQTGHGRRSDRHLSGFSREGLGFSLVDFG